ncbi:MAG TPA: hypothetical protein VFS08_12215 [Gemmatimonadaceae bacterium]|nr:hypothetical protein [Gemmatimonadaceae bacterium]
MTTNRALELLYDSEATLRLVDHELNELRELTGADDAVGAAEQAAGPQALDPMDGPIALAMIPSVLERANAEIVNVLGSLRQCRSALESATSEKLQITHAKIREVTSATELAATDILDGLDRAQSIIDEMDAEAAKDGEGSPRGRELRDRLRDEIFSVTGCLQFQDITTQQLAYAGSVLVEMEERLSEIARLFDPRRYGAPELPVPSAPPVQPTFSPDAAYRDATARQAMADQLFVTPPAPED